MRREQRLFLIAAILLCVVPAGAQSAPSTDVLGAHDFSAGGAGVTGPSANACMYCHAPHHGLSTVPLWNQTLSTAPAYQTYTSPTAQNATGQPAAGKATTLCLSCHDGTLARGIANTDSTRVGASTIVGGMTATGAVGEITTELARSHPVSLATPLRDAVHLNPAFAGSGTTGDAAVKLVEGTIECSTCHDVHNQYIDNKARKFLVRDNTGGQLCLTCHTTTSRSLGGRSNPLATLPGSAHANSSAGLKPGVGFGAYVNVKEAGCGVCHASHDSSGAGLLRRLPALAGVDGTSQACLTCHGGTDVLAQALPNVLAEFQKSTAHPFADSSNAHTLAEPAQLERNRHATCADCHNGHASEKTTTFATGPALRPSQKGVAGVSADGAVLNQATNQYENCLRCHGAGAGKQSLAKYGYMPARTLFSGDILNVALQFSASAISAHPVMRDARGGSQPSLLPGGMWNLTFTSQTRPMAGRLLCTDCHNSDANREFGGTGPNGPHGSANDHLLERRYTISQVSPVDTVASKPGGGPGSTIINVTPSPILIGSASPFALCAKCHDLNNVASDVSFRQHSRHMQKNGFSCSTCHSAHGVPAGTIGVTGSRLVTFDTNVVAPNTGTVPTYAAATQTCNLTCHGKRHR